MTIKDFNRLSQDKQIELLTKRLGEMKKDKLKTADFTNKEFNFSWPSQKIRDFGYLIIPELSEPPVRTLGSTIPENESHIFRQFRATFKRSITYISFIL